MRHKVALVTEPSQLTYMSQTDVSNTGVAHIKDESAYSDPRAHPQLRVQRAAARTKLRHFLRAIRRLTILGATDLTVLTIAIAALQGFRGAAWSSAVTLTLFPSGFMGGWSSNAGIIAGLLFAGAYRSEGHWYSSGTVFKGVALGSALLLWQSINTLGIPWTGTRWIVVTLVLGAAILAGRILLFHVIRQYRTAAKPNHRVILVGDPEGPAGERGARALLNRPGMQSIGWLSEQVGAQNHLGHPSAVWEVLCHTGTDTVLLCDDLPPALFDTVIEAAAVAGCRVLSLRDSGTLMATQPRALNDGKFRILELTFPAGRAGQDAVKRIFDFVASSLILVLLSPLMVLISIGIRLDSPGSVFFIQERVGKAGELFPMIKFRTMRAGADHEKTELAHLNESGDPRLFKIPDDPRVTSIGVLLRRWSLDELPQLLNVVRGDMSLVGPRPFFDSDLAAYDDHHFIRLAVKPGITGLWQVRGRSSIVDFEEVVRLDRFYIENWSLGLGLSILVSTLPAVLRRTGAY